MLLQGRQPTVARLPLFTASCYLCTSAIVILHRIFGKSQRKGHIKESLFCRMHASSLLHNI